MPTQIPKVEGQFIPEGVSKEQESVFDPLHETLLKRAARAVGYDDPNAGVQSFLNPMGIAAPLIAKFPLEKAEKTVRNIVLRNHLEDKVSPAVMSVVEKAMKKYPRLMAHLLDVQEGPITSPNSFQRTIAEFGGHDNPIEGYTGSIYLDPKLAAEEGVSLEEAFGHELTHHAQNLWNQKKFYPRYKELEKKFGYWKNPMELSANKAGQNFANPAARVRLKKSATELATPDNNSAIQSIMDLFDTTK